MASIFNFYRDAANFKREIVTKYKHFAESDKKLYFSAVAIQKSWRGYKARSTIKDWNRKATLIQKFIRGWLVRIHLPECLEDYYYNQSIIYYNQKAVKIQALWKGHYVRKTTISIKDLIRERLEIETVSKEMQLQIHKAFEDLKKKAESVDPMEQILIILFNRHHLLRTKVQEGVLSLHGQKKLSFLEELLKGFNLVEYMREIHNLENEERQKILVKKNASENVYS